jgi:hydroxyethylthiazole kinase-like uncharacterized protein yjeF
VIPILTPAEMKAVDAAAAEPVEELIHRAGGAVARAAVDLLGGTYGRRVVVIAGPGNNGADGRDAAARLRRRGVHVDVVEPRVPSIPPCDLVIDAAYGTGFHGTWSPPSIPDGALVLAVDIPSGVDGLTGTAAGDVLRADRTVTFAALKPGLLFSDTDTGGVELVDIGLDVSSARAHLVTDDDVHVWLPERPVDAHKYHAAVWLIAGSPTMRGAAALATAAALRAGSGYVRVSSPGTDPEGIATEAVRHPLPAAGWAPEVLADLDRFRALAVGPGLGRGGDDDVHALLRDCPLPIVVDADALTTLDVPPGAVLTPHDGEYARLVGERPQADRFEAARTLAAKAGATVALKGQAIVVASPDGDVLVAASGDQRLATAGSGDVLTGITAALLAQGLDPLRAAGAAAHLLGRAADLGWRRGLVSGDLPALLAAALDLLD